MLRPVPLLRNGAAAVAVVLLVWFSQAASVDGGPPIWLPSGLAWPGLRPRPGQSDESGASFGSAAGGPLAARWGPRRDVLHAITTLVVFVLACWLGGLLVTLLAGQLSLAPLLLAALDAKRPEP
jgi:hypothetical protein